MDSFIWGCRAGESDSRVVRRSELESSAREGDSLWDIGKRYYVPVAQIREINELAGDEIQPGEKLLIVKGVS